MSDDHVSRNEFDLYVKMNAETNQSIAEAIEAIKTQGQDTLDVLKEYTIHNNHKHEKSADRTTALAKEFNRSVDSIKEELREIKETVIESAEITKFWRFVGKYLKYSAIGALTVLGGFLIKLWLSIP